MLKGFFFLSPFAAIALFLSLQVSVTSCTKTHTVIDTIVKTQTDTLQEKDTVLTTAILTANSWKLLQERVLANGNYVYYVRGGSNNTQNFDNEYITFNANGTGTYTDNSGGQSSFTWNFTDASNTKLTWNWNLPQPVLVTWENISFDDGSLHYTEYYTQFGSNILSSAMRIPK